MFRDRRVNRKWRRVFRTLYAILAFSLLITFFPLGEEIETIFASAGLVAALTGMVFLWFVYNMPEKLKMREELENDFEENNN